MAAKIKILHNKHHVPNRLKTVPFEISADTSICSLVSTVEGGIRYPSRKRFLYEENSCYRINFVRSIKQTGNGSYWSSYIYGIFFVAFFVFVFQTAPCGLYNGNLSY